MATSADTTTQHTSESKRIIENVLRFVLPLGVSAWMLVWLFQRIDFAQMWQLITHGVDYWWLVLMMIITAMSHAIRGTRWGIQLAGVGVRPPLITLWVSIFGAYSLNLLFSGVGEAWRVVYISRREHTPLATVVGTDVGDRLSDAAVIMLLLVLLLVMARSYVAEFLMRFPLGRDFVGFVGNPWLWITLVALAAGVWAMLHFFSGASIVVQFKKCCTRIWHGFAVLFTMKGKWEYLLLTFGIWTCYFMETYVSFQSMPATRALFTPELAYGFLPGLVCFVFCSMSMAIPSNGGLGPWNIAMVFGLTLFGVNITDATAFAMLMWSAQSLMLILLGLYSAAYIAITNRHSKDIRSASSVDKR